MKRASRQFELLKRPWGGRRTAGRKPAPGRGYVPHRRRPAHDPRCPVHATLRVHADLPSLRRDDVFGATRAALARASHDRFRVLHFSVQTDHVHLLLEGDGHIALQRGLQGLAIRVARTVNRTLGRRGKLWADRYHARVLATPREVRHALVYVLQNVRKHLRGVRGLRSAFVGAVVFRLANADRRSTGGLARCAGADVARRRRVATTRTRRYR